MIKQKSGLDWAIYARTYDMLLNYNPFYQKLRKEVIEYTKDWPIQADDMILDLGAGTGNYSLALAAQFPEAQILHIEPNEGMNFSNSGEDGNPTSQQPKYFALLCRRS